MSRSSNYYTLQGYQEMQECRLCCGQRDVPVFGGFGEHEASFGEKGTNQYLGGYLYANKLDSLKKIRAEIQAAEQESSKEYQRRIRAAQTKVDDSIAASN